MAIWPEISAADGLGFELGLLLSAGDSSSLGTIFRTRNSRATPKLKLPIIARGPR